MPRVPVTALDRAIAMSEAAWIVGARRRDLELELREDALRNVMAQHDTAPIYRPAPGRPRSGVMAE